MSMHDGVRASEGRDDFWETLAVMSIRFLQEESTSNETSTGNSTAEDELIPPNDGQVLRDTLKVYGSIFAVAFFLFCCLRAKYPRAFNIRSWSTFPDDMRCALADEEYGFISWLWQVRLASDDDIREQCGMDALCFLRMLYFGYKICLLGMFNSIWLFPLYATAGAEYEETNYITDRVARLTVSYVPSGSVRFVGTVVATYLIFFYTMYLIIKEYEWFTYHRHCYLSATEPRNYSIYVAGIPEELRSDQKLLRYFRDCFSTDAVLSANVALKIPKLEKTVAKRDGTVLKLEHLVNIEEIKGKTPMRRSLKPTDPPEDAIAATLRELYELNAQVAQDITSIEVLQKQAENDDNASLTGRSYVGDGLSVVSGATGGGYSVHSSLRGGGTGYSMSNVSRQGGNSKTSLVGSGQGLPSEDNRLDESIALAGGEAESVVKENTTESVSDEDDSKRESGEKDDLGKSNHSGHLIGSLHKTVAGGVSNAAGSLHKTVAGGVSNAASNGMGLATSAVSMILGGEDGKPRSGGFVSFKKLSVRQAALQMIHNATPFCMNVSEGPDPDDIKWSNVGKSNKALQIGTVISFTLTCLLCLFWTIPVSFIASLTSVESLSQQIPFLADWIEKAPWLGELLAVLAPLLLVGINALLPTILELFSTLEGVLSEGALSSSTFSKLSAFMIIQTFFVSAISGSIFEELSNIAKQPDLVVELLSTSLPAQSTYFLQILLVQTFIGLSTELLRVSPFAKALGRSLIGPNLTKEERQRTLFGFLRPLNDPLDFQHPEIGSNNVLYFMVLFVYTAMAPLVNWFLAFCFILMNSAYRYQFFCCYPQRPDSGGQMWISFIRIVQFSAIVAQITLFGFLALKRTAIAIPLLVPLLIINLLFQWYISQKHNQVATFLASHECIEIDRKNYARGPMDYSFLIDEYKQSALKAKEDVLPDNLTVSREVQHGNDAYGTPPGSVADLEEFNDEVTRSSLLEGT